LSSTANVVAKRHYVPSNRAGEKEKEKEKETVAKSLPEPIGQSKTGMLFRGIPWSGQSSVERAPAVFVPTEKPNLDQACGAFFSAVRWTGSAPAAVTPEQSSRSVRAILSNFRWEKT
jgi:hypothetical protein